MTVVSELTRDTSHYWDVLIFSVEGILFKLPKYQFVKNSEVFETMCSLPQGESSEGSSDDNPIKLEGVKSVDFRAFVNMLYPLKIPQQLPTTKEEWISILKLSTMWRFLCARKIAIDTLTGWDMTPFERIQLARDYFVTPWLRTGYFDLAKREETLSDEDVAIVGYASAIRIFRVREKIRKTRPMPVVVKPPKPPSPTPIRTTPMKMKMKKSLYVDPGERARTPEVDHWATEISETQSSLAPDYEVKNEIELEFNGEFQSQEELANAVETTD